MQEIAFQKPQNFEFSPGVHHSTSLECAFPSQKNGSLAEWEQNQYIFTIHKYIFQESITRVDPFNNGSCNPSKTLSKENIYRNYLSSAANLYSVKVVKIVFSVRRFMKTRLNQLALLFIVYSFNYQLCNCSPQREIDSNQCMLLQKET